MKKFIEHGKNFIKNTWEKGKKALLIVSTASMLTLWLNSCNNGKTDFYKDKNAAKIENNFVDSYRNFYKEQNLNIIRVALLADNEEKTVILNFGNFWAKVSFIYKNKNTKEIYSNLSGPANMQVSTIENWKIIRDLEKVSIDEAKQVLAEITSYMK
jgi:hypothetical protein